MNVYGIDSVLDALQESRKRYRIVMAALPLIKNFLYEELS